MISRITGTIQIIRSASLIIMTQGGVGYEITTTKKFAHEQCVGDTITLQTYMKVSENSMQLFGFESMEERIFFELVLSVSGVGPRTAMNILALGSIEEIESAIARGDAMYLSAVQGIGKKTAERMVVELKSKVTGLQSTNSELQFGTAMAEVIDVLVDMGYDKGKIREILKELKGSDTEKLLRDALKILGR